MISSVLSSLVVLQASNATNTASFFGFFGVMSALVLACLGAAYGTAKSGVGVAAMGVMHPQMVMRAIIPVVMAGVVGIYGLIISVIISTNVNYTTYTAFQGFAHMGAGLSVGLAGLSAGISVGIVGDVGVRSVAQQPKVFVGMILMLIFSEALGLYGLIVALIVQGKGSG